MVNNICVSIHKSVETEALRFWEEMRRRYYTTPSSYLEFIKVYSSMLHNNNAKFENNRSRLINGLAKLSEANSLVGIMQDELVSIGPKIEEKAKVIVTLLVLLFLKYLSSSIFFYHPSPSEWNFVAEILCIICKSICVSF